MGSTDPCLAREQDKVTKCNEIEEKVAIDIDINSVQVTCYATCGSLIFDIYIEVSAGQDTAIIAAVNNAYPDTNALQSAFGVTVVAQTMAYATTVSVDAPPSPSIPPVPIGVHCGCDEFHNGVMPSTDVKMCVKDTAGKRECYPFYGGPRASCPRYTSPCTRYLEICQDTAGRWARKKCPKMALKNKCDKKKAQRKCPSSCGLGSCQKRINLGYRG